MNLRMAFAILWVGVLCACATPQQITPVRSGESITIDVFRGPHADGAISVVNQALFDESATGARAGVVIGGVLGLACGPFMVICIPTFALAAGGTGGLAGMAVGATGALSEAKATQLHERLTRLWQSYDPLDDLRGNVTDRARRHWDLTSGAPKSVVSVELYDMMLVSTRDEHVALIMRVLVDVRAGDEPQTTSQNQRPPYVVPSSLRGGSTQTLWIPPRNQKLYEYLGPPSSLAAWLDEQSDFLAASFRTASQQIAARIVSELAMQ